MSVDVLVLFEHPEWQAPLFRALERRGLRYAAFDLKRAAFDPAALPAAQVVFNQASPSAFVRGHDRAVPMALALLRSFEAAGTPVINGHGAFAVELSKAAQLALLQRLGVRAPRSLAFGDVEALEAALARQPFFPFPALLKPDQGGSGARMHEVASFDELADLARDPTLWRPDPVLLLQEKLHYDPEFGIVRLEIVGGELLYAMRVVARGAFNLCPSEVCNPSDRPAVSFHPYPEVPDRAVEDALKIARAAGMEVAGLEYVEVDGEPVFYDVNANSNLRPAVAEAFGLDPFERVVDFLAAKHPASRAA